MKAKIYLVFLLSSSLLAGCLQKAFLNTAIEKTKIGLKHGAQLSQSFHFGYEADVCYRKITGLLQIKNKLISLSLVSTGDECQGI